LQKHKAGSVLNGLQSSVGGLIGGVTGVVSRGHYAWGGASYQRYGASGGDRRPDLLFYSAAYGYRPGSMRTDSGWDWRIFAEMTGERSGAVHRASLMLPGTRSHQVFFGPTALGLYKNYAVSAGVQFPVYRSTAPLYARERVRFALNVAYFF
jgi:hypothetical protein